MTKCLLKFLKRPSRFIGKVRAGSTSIRASAHFHIRFAAISADLKALLERAGYVAYANNHAFTAKIKAAVVAVRRGGATHVYDTINHMFQMSRIIIPFSTYWNMGFGLGKGEVLKDEEGLANMRHLGKSIDWLGKAIIPHISNYPKS